MLRNLTARLETERVDLSGDEIRAVVPRLLSADEGREEKAAFLLALRRKGESAPEISAFVTALLERATDPGIDPARLDGPLIDPCGTGGDSLDLFNVSTAAMFLLAAGGARVIKHGNRAITSRSGGADVLEELGIPIRLSPAGLRESLARHGFAFAFAPEYHPAFQVIGPVRRMLAERGERSIFNLLGPLLNPARPPYQLTGVFAPEFVPVFAEVFVALGRARAWAVHGRVDAARGMDEISPLGPTERSQCADGIATHGQIDPAEFGLPAVGSIEPLRGAGPAENARVVVDILRGEVADARRDFVLMNAAAGFVVAGLAPSLSHGVELGLAQISSGRALARLESARTA